MASWLLLKPFAVNALAIAIARLPGQALFSLLVITEQTTPLRSTTADHIRFGLNNPPLPSCTTLNSCSCTLLTTPASMAQGPNPLSVAEAAVADNIANEAPAISTLFNMLFPLLIVLKSV